MDRTLKRYLWLELVLGIIATVLGFLLGGPLLSTLGSCMIALSARCSVHSGKYHGAVIALGLFSLVMLGLCALISFVHVTSLSRYAENASPLAVLFVLALFLLAQCFLLLPLENRSDLSFLRQGILVTAVFAGISFGSIVLTYLLSYVICGSALSLYADGVAVQDFHYLEGAVALAMAFTGARAVLMAYTGKEPLENNTEDVTDEAA